MVVFYNNYELLSLPIDLSTSLLKHTSVDAQEELFFRVKNKIEQVRFGNLSHFWVNLGDIFKAMPSAGLQAW